jgi:peptide-methionine (R)-S-oxide reductase
MERPYTGNLWGEVAPGFYHCVVCGTRLFTFDQKIRDESGYASFYDCVEKRVTILEERTDFELVNLFSDYFLEKQIERNKRCQCGQCQVHIGAVLFNGAFPTFLKFAINSQALLFTEL